MLIMYIKKEKEMTTDLLLNIYWNKVELFMMVNELTNLEENLTTYYVIS